MRGGGGVQVGLIPARGRPAMIRTIIPRDPNLPRGIPLGVVEYGVWGPVIQAPASGRTNIVGSLLPPLPQGRISPSPCVRNSQPSLPIIPITPLLCARPRGDGAGSAPASTPPPVSSLVISSVVIGFVCIYSIIFIVVVIVELEISTLSTSYHQLPPPNQKIGFVSCFSCPIWKN